MGEKKADLLIIGAGPAGYVGAIRAAQLGMKPVILEKEKPGGVCLNWGCIPSKSLIHQAEVFASRKELEEMGVTLDLSGFSYELVQKQSRKVADQVSRGIDYLFKKNGITHVPRAGRLAGEARVELEDGTIYEADHILLATGSRPRELPFLPFDGKKVLSSTDALKMTERPESIIILGGGAIGCEFAHILSTFGTRVTLVEMLPRLLPGADGEVVAVLERSFKRRGIKVLKDTQALGADLSGDGVTLKVSAKGTEQELKADKILVVTGRVPNTEDLGLDKAGIAPEKGFIPVGPGYRTSASRIRAAGDIVAGPMLAHLASKEAERAVEATAGQGEGELIPRDLIPAAVYTEPQIAGFGYTEERAKEEGIPYSTAVFPFKAVGKAAAIGRTEGLVKIITDPTTGEILGGHGVGSQVTEIIHELLLAKTSELLTRDLAEMIHAHPSLSEAVMEAAKAAEGGAIHI